MAFIVQKFGGSSVADKDRIYRVAGIIADTYCEGNSLVVVLSAQGKTTDGLIAKAHEINSNPSKRELDMLLSIPMFLTLIQFFFGERYYVICEKKTPCQNGQA